jgi:hypothetical protein
MLQTIIWDALVLGCSEARISCSMSEANFFSDKAYSSVFTTNLSRQAAFMIYIQIIYRFTL